MSAAPLRGGLTQVLGLLMSIYVPLISALLGALIGAAASVGTVLVQSSAQNKRERRKDAVQLALEDWKTRVAIITKKGTGAAPPLSVFVHYHAYRRACGNREAYASSNTRPRRRTG